jgi:probable F420-dependent oxidoreductase
VKYWQAVAMLDMRELTVLAKHAEELGFEGIILSEHLVTFQQQYEEYAYSKNSMIRWYPETHWPDPWVQIAALSQNTQTLKFLTGVYVLPMHDPFSAAKAIGTAANLCDGRLTLGIGIGWQKTEFDLVGQVFTNRGRRTDEMIEVMKKLWSGEVVAHEGRYYNFPPLQMSPAVERPVSVMVGGFSDAALQRAARNDGWIGGQHDMSELEVMVPKLLALRQQHSPAESGRFDVAAGLYQPTPGNIERCKELGVTKLYREAFCDENGMASKMTLKEKLNDMDAFARQYLS